MAKSLIEGMDNLPGGSSKNKGGGGGAPKDHAKTIKLAVGVVLLGVAGVLFAYQFGLLGGSEFEQAAPDKAEKNRQEAEAAVQEEEQLILEEPELEKSGSG